MFIFPYYIIWSLIIITIAMTKIHLFSHGDFSRNKEIITHQQLLTDEQIHKLTPTATDQLIFKRLKLGKNIKCKNPLPAKVKESIKKICLTLSSAFRLSPASKK